jgi:hypothetical protein
MSLDRLDEAELAFEREERESLVGRLLSGRGAWWAVAAAGFVVFELTADAALAIVLACLKFGWDETRIARRLKREDPNRDRGRVCARFYQAYALWKVSGVAFVAMFLVVFVQAGLIDRLAPGAAQARGGKPPAAFVSVWVLLIVCFTLSALWSIRATVGALRKGVRVWVGRGRNRLKPILLSVMVVWGSVLTLLGLFVVMVVVLGPNAARPPGWLVSAASIGMGVGFPVFLLVGLDCLERRIAAGSPEECWPELLAREGGDRPAFLELLRV